MSSNQPQDLEDRVGHPGERWDALLQRVQDEAVVQFQAVEKDWLDLMWCLDAYRIAGIAPPAGMGNTKLGNGQRLAAVYRMKGNWFAQVIAALLQNRTHQEIAAKTEILGFSQHHRMDVLWPARTEDALVCIATRVTGAPAFGETPSRGALADWTNRRKELKFMATDLKLYRGQQGTRIECWGEWRNAAPPASYFMWAARLKGEGRRDKMDTLVREAGVLVETYLEGAGILAWHERADRRGYETTRLPKGSPIGSLDDIMDKVTATIRRLAPEGKAPAPQTPFARIAGAAKVLRGPSSLPFSRGHARGPSGAEIAFPEQATPPSRAKSRSRPVVARPWAPPGWPEQGPGLFRRGRLPSSSGAVPVTG